MLESYRRILSLPGTALFSLTGLVARLPISMVGLGIVLLVSSHTGTYGLAGTVSAAAVLGSAAGSPLQGRLTDRFGQARVLPVLAVVFALGIAALVTSVGSAWPIPIPHLIAAVTGLSLPQIGSMVRARWTYTLDDRSVLQTAFALEAVMDEIIFIVGPVLVTVLATAVHPFAGLVCAGVAGTAGTVLLAVQRRTEPGGGDGTADGSGHRTIGWRLLGPLVLASLGLGAVFGALEVVTVALASEHDVRNVSGVLLAAFATGSMLAGVAAGAASVRLTSLMQFRLATTFLTLAFLPLSVGGPLPLAGVLLFVCGLAVAPALIALISLVERVVPRHRLTEGIGWTMTGLGGGVASGAAIAGWSVDGYGASTSYLVCLGSAMMATLIGWSVRHRVPTGVGAGNVPAPGDV